MRIRAIKVPENDQNQLMDAALVQAELDKANARYAQVEQVKRFVILDHDLTQETGELTPTLKVKRKACTQKYKKEIDAMYDGESVD